MADLASRPRNSFLDLIEAQIGAAVPGWRFERGNGWVYAAPVGVAVPDQGWKLHVSANPGEGAQVLSRCLPVLGQFRVHFKACVDDFALLELNRGAGGLGQIGKFLTVYPGSDDAAVDIAGALHTATSGMSAPTIRSEARYAPDSIVYYRYGGFADRTIRLPSGARFPALARPDGSLVPDVRGAVPAWVVNPFPKAPSNSGASDFPSRFVIVGRIASTPQATVAIAFDATAVRKCVLKIARRGDACAEDGSDAYRRLTDEYRILKGLQGGPGIPEVYELLELERLAILVMQDLESGTLAEWSRRAYVADRPPTDQGIVEMATGIARALGFVHGHGLAFRDLKPDNVVLDAEGRPFLIDFGSCLSFGERGMPGGAVAFMAPQQAAGEGADPRDDVYSLGAVLCHLATGADPARALRTGLRCPTEMLAPRRDPALASVIETCLAERREDRFASAQEVAEALAHAPGSPRERLEPAACDFHAEVEGLAGTIRRSALRGSRGICWPSQEGGAPERPNYDINAGTAGTVLALADAYELLGHPEDREILAEATVALLSPPDDDRRPVTGLCVGECGIGFALLRAYGLLGDASLLEGVLDIANSVGQTESYCEDLFCGDAGRIKFLLNVNQALGEARFLPQVTELADRILASAQSTESGGLFWNVKTGLDGKQAAPLLGYAHGAAGIGDALLDAYSATQESRFSAAAFSVWETLRMAMSDGVFPVSINGPYAAPFWCHGAGGIAKFIFHLSRTKVGEVSESLLDTIGDRLVHGARWAGPVLCHGLAGNIDALLDLYDLTGSRQGATGAQDLANLLGYLKVETAAGPAYLGDGPEPYPDFMVGYGGVLSVLARLARGDVARGDARPALLPAFVAGGGSGS